MLTDGVGGRDAVAEKGAQVGQCQGDCGLIDGFSSHEAHL
jgi:hypothetical protein